MNPLTTLNQEYSRQKSEFDLIMKELSQTKKKLKKCKRKHNAAIHARAYLQNISQKTQNKLESYISNLVTLSLHSVFSNPYEFYARFVQRRNKTECDLIFLKNEEEYKPVDSSGGGPLDIASLTLQITFWSFSKNRPTLILDEPAKWVSEDLHEKVSIMLKKISEKLKIQLIIISHQNDMIAASDKTFHIKGGRIINE